MNARCVRYDGPNDLVYIGQRSFSHHLVQIVSAVSKWLWDVINYELTTGAHIFRTGLHGTRQLPLRADVCVTPLLRVNVEAGPS